MCSKNCKGKGFVTEYTHYRTKKLMRAKDYGYEAWYFGGCPKCRRRKK